MRGYDAMRVSPSVTNKNGYKYRKVFGGVVGYGGDRYPTVKWEEIGYIKESRAKGGTKLLRDTFNQLVSNYGWKGKEALLKSKLMLK
ncbi:MAG: hypothetical protein Q4P17_07675 [Methanobacterium sp.]|nr:hypothetical protein [Methanobacterium sp.]